MNSSWSSADDEILIDFVRAHEILYNVKCKGYRQTQVKQKLWCEVGEILNKTDSDCYKRWCYVRDYYIRRKGKAGTVSSGETAKKRSELLSFLDSLPSSQRQSISNVIIEVYNPEENTQDNKEQNPFQKHETEDMALYNEDEGDSSTDMFNKNNNSKCDLINDEDIKKEFTGGHNIKSNQKRKYNSDAQDPLKQAVDGNLNALNELDETDLFFSSMAKIVKKLPRYEQARLRMQIGSLVGNAELRSIPQGSPPISVSPRPSTSGSDYVEIAIPAASQQNKKLKKLHPPT